MRVTCGGKGPHRILVVWNSGSCSRVIFIRANLGVWASSSSLAVYSRGGVERVHARQRQRSGHYITSSVYFIDTAKCIVDTVTGAIWAEIDRWRDIRTGYIGILNRGGRLVPTHYRLGSTQQGYFICCGNAYRWEQFDFPSIRRMILIVTL